MNVNVATGLDNAGIISVETALQDANLGWSASGNTVSVGNPIDAPSLDALGAALAASGSTSTGAMALTAIQAVAAAGAASTDAQVRAAVVGICQLLWTSAIPALDTAMQGNGGLSL